MTWQTEIVHAPRSIDDPATPAFRRWLDENARAFLRSRTSDGAFEARLRAAHHDGRVARQVVDNGTEVGTFCHFPWRLDLGAGETPFWAITNATVRPTHRRRGMLRDMITDSLARAAAQGMPMAGLTATEGSSYARFGFGPASSRWAAEIDTAAFALRTPVPGTVELVEPGDLAEDFDALAELTRAAWPGVYPMSQQRDRTLALWDPAADAVPTDLYAAVFKVPRSEVACEAGGEGTAADGNVGSSVASGVRESPSRVPVLANDATDGGPDFTSEGQGGDAEGAARVGAPSGRRTEVDGEADGEHVDGAILWRSDRSAARPTLTVESLWGSPAAVRALLEFACAVDLVELVEVPFAPPVDQVRAALVDPRAVTVTGHEDEVWLRPLDVPACVAARPWGADGELDLMIDDPLGYATGTWRVTVQQGRGHAEPGEALLSEPTGRLGVSMSVDTFGSLLGEASLLDLALAGRVQVRHSGGPAKPDALAEREALAEAARVVGRAPSHWGAVHF